MGFIWFLLVYDSWHLFNLRIFISPVATPKGPNGTWELRLWKRSAPDFCARSRSCSTS